MNSDFPIIEMKENGKQTYYNYEVTVSEDGWYDKICEEARSEIPKEELFNWWVNNALRQTIKQIENQTPIQNFWMKLKIRFLRLTGRL